MDTHYEIPPRLRLNRQATSFAATVDDSNFHNTFNYEREREASDEGDDDGSTPRLGREKMSVDSFDEPLNFSAQAQAQSTPALSAAERLRAVLSRASSLTPTVRTQNASSDRTPVANAAGLRESDMESDFETPRPPANGVAATPYSNHSVTSTITHSTARESLRSIVAHALRSPGNSPERSRRPRRRGSMDSSIVEESPIKWSALKPGERPKRISLSDDEKERIKTARSGYADENSFESFTSSQAVIYDQLRRRLEGPRADVVRNNGKSLGKSNMTIDTEEATEVEEQLLQRREVPVKTKISEVPRTSNASAAQQSMSQFPSQFLGSNLLTENSDMQRMIGEAQTDATDSEASQSNRKDEKTPAAGAPNRPNPLVRPRAISRSGSMSSIGSSDSRPTSRQSMNDFENDGRKHERERGWNHPLGPYMERHRAASPLYSTHSGGIGRMRNVSLGSISGSESDFGQSSPASTAKRQNDLTSEQRNFKYAGIASGRFPSSTPNQIRGSDRTRTVSQPTKPNSPGSSAKSDRTQKPFDRPRTISLITPGPSHPSSNHVHGRLPSKYSHDDSPSVEYSDRPLSPSSSRPSSRASSRASLQLGSPNGHERIHVRERNWNSPHSKRNAPVSPSLPSERKRTGSTTRTTSQQRSHVTQAAGSSSTTIPRPSVKERSHHTRQVVAGEGTEVRERKARNLTVLTATSASTLANVKRGTSSKDKDVRQHALPKSDHKALLEYESEFGRVRPGAPTLSAEMNGTESEEHDTPRLRQQHIPGSPTPGGSRPNSRAGFLHGVKGENDRENGFMHTAPIAEKERRQGGAEKGESKRSAKASVPPEAIDLRESDLDSFQEEDIVASSSAPRLPNGNNLHDESDAASTNGGLHADIGVLRPGHDLRLNGREGAYGKKSAVPTMVSPPLSPPDPVTSTPQRRGSANASKVGFRTPSPPRSMPALPGPPLSEEDVASDKIPPTPVTPSNKTRNIDAKTPRFPGAWATPFATPAPVGRFRSSAFPRDNQAGEKLVPLQDEAHGYPASYSRAASIVMKTPAPPGAWYATPGTIAAKRLQQKVRFDEHEPSAAPALVPTGDDGTVSSDFSVANGSVAMKAAGKVKSASPRTPGRIRVVDAFGNEIMSTKNGDQRRPTQKLEKLHITGRNEKSTNSDGRKARIRVLDAMGREVTEPQAHGRGAASIPDESAKQPKPKEGESVAYSGQELVGRQLERKEALQLLRRTITELKDDFNETDDPASTRTTDDIDAQITSLKTQSIRAREDRERLLQKIRNVSAGNPPSRLSALWTVLLRGKNAPGLSTRSTHVKVFITLIFIQVAMFFAFYWLSSLGARQLYLATYIDPFYSELHMQHINPDYLRLAMATNDDSETRVSTMPSWVGPILALLHGILGRLLIVKESIWDIWRDAPQSMPWPPT